MPFAMRCPDDHHELRGVYVLAGFAPHYVCSKCSKPYVEEVGHLVPCIHPDEHIDRAKIPVSLWATLLKYRQPDRCREVPA
jgi:hypothetical protein